MFYPHTDIYLVFEFSIEKVTIFHVTSAFIELFKKNYKKKEGISDHSLG